MLILTEAMCAMWIDSSCRPIHPGVKCTTLVGVMRTCVGRRRLPRLNRLARKTSPAAKGRPLSQTTKSHRAAPAPASAHQIHV